MTEIFTKGALTGMKARQEIIRKATTMNTKTQTIDPTGTDIALAQSRELVSNFPTGEQISELVALTRAEAVAAAAKFDITTVTGRNNIISVAVTVRDKKVKLSKAADQSKVEHQAIIKEINEGKNTINVEFQGVQDEIRQPVTDWELAEKQRVVIITDALNRITAGLYSSESYSGDLEIKIDHIAGIVIDDSFQERKFEASDRKRVTLETLGGFLAAAIKREAMEKELAERRAADTAREELEAYEALQVEAETENKAFDQAFLDAEIAEALRAEAERRRVEQAASDATKVAEKKATTERLEAERKHQKEIDDAETARKAEKKRADAEQAQRDANQKLRDDARAAIVGFLGKLDRKQVVAALMNNEVPHVTLKL